MPKGKAKEDIRGGGRVPRANAANEGIGQAARWARPAAMFALGGLFVAAPLVPGESAIKGSGVPLAMLWLVFAAACLLAVLSYARISVRFGLADLALALLIACHGVSGCLLAWHGNPRQTYNMVWQWVGYGAAYLLARQLVRAPAEARALHALMIALAAGLSGLACYQYFYTMPMQRAEYRRMTETEQTAWIRQGAGIEAPPGSRERVLFENRLESREPLATFALTNSLAGFLVPWLVAAAGISAASLPWSTTPRRVWLALAGAALITTGCLVLTKSRTAYLATALGGGLAFLAARARSGRLPWWVPATGAAALAALVVGAALAGGLDREVLAQAPKSVLYRLEYWQATAAMIAAHPWWGVGPGNFQEFYGAFKLPQASETIADPHNFLLEVWATAGSFAFLALLGFLASLVYALWRANLMPGEAKSPAASSLAIANSAVESASAEMGHPRALLWGGLAGAILAFPYGLLVGFPPEFLQLPAALADLPIVELSGLLPAFWFVSVPLAAATAWCLLPWVEAGRLPLAVPAAALGALLFNLLAAGGIGFPGVSNSVWLLAAVLLGQAGGSERSLPRAGLLVVLLAVLGLVLACHQTAYAPLLSAAPHVEHGKRALSAGDYAGAERAFQAAAAADPYAAEPREFLATLALRDWREFPTAERLARLDANVREFLRRDRQSSAARIKAGDWYLLAFRQTHERPIIERAAAEYRAAIERYPNGSLGHVRLAWASALSGNQDEARSAAAEALRLDALTPHEDKKLAMVTNLAFDPGPRGSLPPGMPGRPSETNLELLARRLAQQE